MGHVCMLCGGVCYAVALVTSSISHHDAAGPLHAMLAVGMWADRTPQWCFSRPPCATKSSPVLSAACSLSWLSSPRVQG